MHCPMLGPNHWPMRTHLMTLTRWLTRWPKPMHWMTLIRWCWDSPMRACPPTQALR